MEDLRKHEIWEITVMGKVLERQSILQNPISDDAMSGAVAKGMGEIIEARERYDRERAIMDGST